MNIKINPDTEHLRINILACISNYKSKGTLIYGGSRNSIKIFKLDTIDLNIKAFKKPNFFKKLIYTYIRTSKAKRSYEFALKLKSMQIGTPNPIAYIVKRDFFGITDSYYVCQHLDYDFMFRDLVTNPELPNHKEILKEFTKFCFNLHENGIEFKDHSPGNTLIVKDAHDRYQFYLVDLNRMVFHDKLTLKQRMYNLRRLTPKLDMVSVIADEYAKLYGVESEKLLKELWENTSKFQRKFHRKKRLKKKFK